MRLGVLDVGSNTVHLLVMDAHFGARPWAAHSHKAELRLVEHLDPDGRIDRAGVEGLVEAVRESAAVAEDAGAEHLMAVETSAIREAANGEQVLAAVRSGAGVALEVLTGDDEARLTFLAVRRWFGWSAGRLLVLDIGGGSLEMAIGIDSEPDTATSLPLGAARLTRDHFSADPPPAEELAAVRRLVRTQIGEECGPMLRFGPPDLAVATSKTFKQLARIAGAAPSAAGIYARRTLTHSDVVRWAREMAAMSTEERAALPGVSMGRAGQLLAGAIVADAAMDLFGVDRLQICPWALREGLILRWFDHLLDTGIGVGDAVGCERAAGVPSSGIPAEGTC